MSKLKQITFNSSVGEFNSLLARVKELTKISDVCKLRLFTTKEVMFYAVDAEARKIAKLKVSFLKITDIFSLFPDDVNELTYIIADAVKWCKQFSFLTPAKSDVNSVISVTISYSPDNGEVFKFIASNTELELHSVGGDSTIIKDDLIKNAPPQKIKQKFNPENGLWQVTISDKQLDDMKKLSRIETDTLITASLDNGVIKIYQRLWHQSFKSSVNAKNGIWHFDRANLEAITQPTKGGSIVLSVAADFMVAHESQSDFMFALELHD